MKHTNLKNLLITTSMGDISGLGNLKGSQKAYDLYSKTQYIHEQNKKLYFLTKNAYKQFNYRALYFAKIHTTKYLKRKRDTSF